MGRCRQKDQQSALKSLEILVRLEFARGALGIPGTAQ